MAKRILFINQEISPYLPESELARMGKALPQKAMENGSEIRTFTPKWGTINERRGQLHEVIRLSGLNIVIDDVDHPLLIKVATVPQTKIQVYFIDNEDYFSKRQTTVDESGEEYADNGERAIFFARGILETVKKLRWSPEVIVCQGWMGAVLPLYLKTVYKDEPCYQDTKIVTSIFSNELRKDLGNRFKQCVEFREATLDLLQPYKETFDFPELGKMAIDYSDGVIEATENANKGLINYAKEKNIPVLSFPGEGALDDYLNFLENL